MTITSNNGNTTNTNVHQTFNNIKAPSQPRGLNAVALCMLHAHYSPQNDPTRNKFEEYFKATKRGQKRIAKNEKTNNNLMGEKND